MSARAVRTEKLDIRLSAAAKQIIVTAASVSKRSVSEFVLERVLARADELLADRSGPTPLNSRPSFLSGVSADAYAASLPVGSITVYASSGVCLSRLECGLD